MKALLAYPQPVCQPNRRKKKNLLAHKIHTKGLQARFKAAATIDEFLNCKNIDTFYIYTPIST